MAAIQGQPAPKPQSLSKPVPGAEKKDAMAEFIAEFSAPEVAAPSPTESSSLSQFQAETGSPQPELQAPMGPYEVPTESLQERYARTGSIAQTAKEALGDTAARFQAAWAVTDAEKEGKLVQIYGRENVRKKGDSFQIRRPGEKGFRSFDPKEFNNALEIVNDALDFSRDITEGAVELGGRAGGGIAGGVLGAGGGAVAGTAAGLPTGPGALATGAAGFATGGTLGAIAGQAAGAGAGAITGMKLADVIQEKIMGIPRDPMREGGKEALITGGIAAGVGTVFGAASGYLARKKIANDLRKSTLTTDEVKKIASEVDEAANSLAQAGIELRQGKMVLSPGQIANQLPEARALDYGVTEAGKARDFFTAQGKLVRQGWEKLQQGITNVTGQAPEDLFKLTKGASKAGKEVEGKTIGTFREQAIALSKGEPWPMMRTNDMTAPFYGELGFSYDKEGKFLKPSMERLQEMFPDASPSVLGKLSSLVGDLETQLNKGKGNMPLAETNRIYGQFRDTIDNWWGTSSGGQVAEYLVPIKNALRDDFAEQAGATLQKVRPEALPGYQVAMKKYSDIIGAQETLKNVLSRKDMSSASFADEIFRIGQNKDQINQIKVLIDDVDPKLWKNLVDQKMDLMLAGATDKAGRVDWQILNRDMNKLEQYGILDKMVAPEEKKMIKDFFTVAGRIDKDFNWKKMEEGGDKLATMVAVMMSKVPLITKVRQGDDFVHSTLKSVGGDEALIKWLNGEGLQLVLNKTAKKDQGRVRQLLGATMESSAAKAALATGMAAQRREWTKPAEQFNQSMMQGVPGFGEQINEARKGTPVGP